MSLSRENDEEEKTRTHTHTNVNINTTGDTNNKAENFHLISYACNGDSNSFSNTLPIASIVPIAVAYIQTHLISKVHKNGMRERRAGESER